MPDLFHRQPAFTGGAVSKNFVVRSDLPEYPISLLDIYNMYPQLEGPLTRRLGIREHGDESGFSVESKPILIPFSIQKDLEFILVIYLNSSMQGVGWVYHYHKNVYQYHTDLTDIPWTDNLDLIRYVQVGTRMWVVHPNYPPHTITYIDDSFKVEPFAIKWNNVYGFNTRPFGNLYTYPDSYAFDSQITFYGRQPSFLNLQYRGLSPNSTYRDFRSSDHDLFQPRGTLVPESKFTDTLLRFQTERLLKNQQLVFTKESTYTVDNRNQIIDRYQIQLVRAVEGEIFRGRITVGEYNGNIGFNDGAFFQHFGSIDIAHMLNGRLRMFSYYNLNPNNSFEIVLAIANPTLENIRLFYRDSRNNTFHVDIPNLRTDRVRINEVTSPNITVTPDDLNVGDTIDIVITTDQTVTDPLFDTALAAAYSAWQSLPTSNIITLPAFQAPNYYRIRYENSKGFTAQTLENHPVNQMRFWPINDSLERSIYSVNTRYSNDIFTLVIGFYPPKIEGTPTYEEADSKRIERYRNQLLEVDRQYSIYLVDISGTVLLEFLPSTTQSATYKPSIGSIEITKELKVETLPTILQTILDNAGDVYRHVEISTKFRIIIAPSFLKGGIVGHINPNFALPNNNYPKVVNFFNRRLIFGNTIENPRGLWFSHVGVFNDFSPHTLQDSVTEAFTQAEDGGFATSILGNRLDEINWIHEDRGNLLLATSRAIWRIQPNPINTVASIEIDNHGSSEIQPVSVNGEIIHVAPNKRDVYGIGFYSEFTRFERYETRQINLKYSINQKITAINYQEKRLPIVWFLLEDGTFLTCSIKRELNILAWARQEFFRYFDNIYTSINVKDIALYQTRNDIFVLYRATHGDSDKFHMGSISGLETHPSNTDNIESFYQDFGWGGNPGFESKAASYTSSFRTLPIIRTDTWGREIKLKALQVYLIKSWDGYFVGIETDDQGTLSRAIATPAVQQEHRKYEITTTSPRPIFNGLYSVQIPRMQAISLAPLLKFETNLAGPFSVAALRLLLDTKDPLIS